MLDLSYVLQNRPEEGRRAVVSVRNSGRTSTAVEAVGVAFQLRGGGLRHIQLNGDETFELDSMGAARRFAIPYVAISNMVGEAHPRTRIFSFVWTGAGEINYGPPGSPLASFVELIAVNDAPADVRVVFPIFDTHDDHIYTAKLGLPPGWSRD